MRFILRSLVLAATLALPLYAADVAGTRRVLAGLGDVNGDGYGDMAEGLPQSHEGRGEVRLYLGGPQGLAKEPDLTLKGQEDGQAFGAGLAWVGDVDGDGKAELLVVSLGKGRIDLFRGDAKGVQSKPWWTKVVAPPGELLVVAGLGDQDGDGRAEFLVAAPILDQGRGKVWGFAANAAGVIDAPRFELQGAPGDYFGASMAALGQGGWAIGAPGAAKRQGLVRVYAKGLTPTVATTLRGQRAGEQFGAASAAGDLEGQGAVGLVIGAPVAEGHEGRLDYFRCPLGRCETLAKRSLKGTVEGEDLGAWIALAGDANGDGRLDLLLGLGAGGGQRLGVLCFGSPRGLPATLPEPMSLSQSARLAYPWGAAAGDFHGDGFSDLALAVEGPSAKPFSGIQFKRGHGQGLTDKPAWVGHGQNVHDDYGFKIMPAGDVNADGYSDVLVGAPGYHDGRGKAYLYLGGPQGLSATPSFTLVGDGINGGLGKSLGGAGDLNGDGYDDVYINEPDLNGKFDGEGRIYVFMGGPQGISGKPAWSREGHSAWEDYGDCSSAIGDINGDGYADLIVGSYGLDHGRGRAEVFLGGPQGLGDTPVWTFEGEDQGDNLGYSHGAAGDINGDGYTDLLLGAKYQSRLFQAGGKAWMFFGGPQGPVMPAAWIHQGEEKFAMFANRLYGAGDVNGDGYADVIVGSPGVAESRGEAELFLGSKRGLAVKPVWRTRGAELGLRLGHSVYPAGDVDGDGYDDVVVGMPGNDRMQGRAALFLGGPEGLSDQAAWALQGAYPGDNLGLWMASAGDVNGDGFADVVVGIGGADGIRGEARLYLGGGGGGVTRHLEQRRMKGQRIGVMGRDGGEGVALTGRLSSPMGPGSERLQASWAYPGQALGAQTAAPGAWGQSVLPLPPQSLEKGALRWRLRQNFAPQDLAGAWGHSPWGRLSLGSLNASSNLQINVNK